ncbi:MAG: carboxyl-terminal processing protease [Paracoccaceae bacterium]|jgi:carboxyl-terminal processing protease
MNKLILAAAGGAIAGMLGTAPLIAPLMAQENTARTTYEYLDLFGDIFERVRGAYVEEVNEKDLIEAAISGMLTSLDPHSSYLPPDAFDDMRVQTKGEFGGLGIEVTMENGFVKVVSPIDETPAAEAGIEAGDFITQIDGVSVLGLTLADAVDSMRGPVGSDITITIAREGMDEPFDVVLTRANIKVRAARARVEGKVGVIRVTSFTEQTYDNLKAGMEKIHEEMGGAENVEGYVLDLRNNPGGLLNQAIAVSDAFLEKGEIVSTRGRDPADSERYNAQVGDLAGGKPMVVLINGGSASASEIVAGALQDHRRAIIIGAKSFGKGSVQTIMPMAGKGALRMTTARYYTPSGRSIQALGIEPDILIEQRRLAAADAAEADAPARKIRSEADLRGRLAEELSDDERRLLEEERARHEATVKMRKDDLQLAYAIDMLAGLAVYSSGK